MRDIFLTALAPVLWGTTYVVTTELLPPDRPLLVAALRALPVGLLLVAIYRTLPKGIWWWRTLVLGALNIGLFFALLFVAAYRLAGGIVATIGAMQPLLVILLSWLLLGNRPLPLVILCAGFGIAGVALLVLDPGTALDAAGVAAALGATLVMAAGVVLTKAWVRPVPLLVFTGWQLAAGGIVLAPIAVLFEGTLPLPTTANLAGFAWLALLNTGLAYALWFNGIERLSAWQVSFLGLLSPVVAVLAGYLVLGQTFSAVQMAGVVLTFSSLVAVQRLALAQTAAQPPHA